jgi:outer membrane protein OmpA-like peptidoglycan-associated protein
MAAAADSRSAGAEGDAGEHGRSNQEALSPENGRPDAADAASLAVNPDAGNPGVAGDERSAVSTTPGGVESRGDGRSNAGPNDVRRGAAIVEDRGPDAPATPGLTQQVAPADGLPAETEGSRETRAALDQAQATLAGLGIDVTRREAGALTANLGNFVQFQTGSVEPDGGAQRFIAEVASGLIPALPLAIRVVGHTDQVGGAWVNDWLSQQRAGAVAQLLAENGIPTTLLSHEGKGESEPLVDPGEADPSAAAVNRRIELHLTRVTPAPGQPE